MKNRIIAKLHEIEKEQQVNILHAVESGSRSWRFESKADQSILDIISRKMVV